MAWHYTTLIAPDFDLFRPAYLGLTYNSMALHLLQGRFDVDPAAIGIEAIVRDGRTYAYFGIFPAVPRLLVAPFLDLATVHVERLSCLIAMLLGALGQVLAVRAALARAVPTTRRALLPPLMVAACLSGPAVMLGRIGALYYEAVLWSWALAMLYVAAALGGLCRDGRLGTGRLAWLAVLAGLCLLTRASTGVGLYVTTGLLLAWRIVWPDGRPLPRRAWAALGSRPVLLASGLLLLFAALAGGVNAARWGTPFSFADWHSMVQLQAKYPDRVRRLDTYGMFNLRRLPLGLVYYLLPIWVWQDGGHYPLQQLVVTLTDGFELPPSSFLLSDPMTVWLIGVGVVALTRHRPALASAAARALLLIGLAVPGLLMLISWGMTFRYRAEFYPFLVAAACLAAGGLAARLAGDAPRLRRIRILLWVLGGLQVVSAEAHGVVLLLSPLDPVEVSAPDGLWRLYGDRWRLLRGAINSASAPPPAVGN